MKKIRKIFIYLFVLLNLLIITGCKKTYSVSYNLDGGILENKINEFSKKDSFELEEPYKEGYIFEGWYLDFNYSGEKITEVNGSIKKDITLYAKWTKVIVKYNVTFNNDDIEEKVEVEENTLLAKPTDPTKEGYNFLGWYLDNQKFDFSTPITSDITLVAKWTKVIVKYNVTFNNDGSETKVEVEENKLLSKPTDPTKKGYKFTGWYLKDQEFDFSTPITSDIILVAKWAKVYKIEFINANIETIETIGDEEIILPIPSKEGYIFDGWYTSYSFSGDSIEKVESGLQNDLIFVAKWFRGYKINYDLQDGIMPDEYQNYYKYESEYKLPIPTKKGYKFKGWTENPNSQYISYMVYVPLVYEEEIYLTAIWEKEIYSVEYIFGEYMYSDYKQLYRAFFSDFYYYIKDYRNQEDKLIKTGANNVEDFLEICSAYTGGAAGMSQIGNNYGSFYLKIDVGGKIEDQHSDDGFIGYCLDNNMYVEFIYFIQEFFYYWRLEEGYTNGPSDPEGTGSDFLASAWASIVDTAKFFYYSPYVDKNDPHRLPSYFFREGYKVPTFYENIPYIVNIEDDELCYVYDWEEGLTLPSTLNFEGYKFLGWYDNPEFEGLALTKLEKGIYDNIKLYAKFEKEE